jgi:prepilin-type N-terminal cleavage/methylation domain-containing protein
MTTGDHAAGRCGGFTLIELLVATAISFVLGSAGFLFFRGQLRSLADQAADLDAIEGARSGLDFMANDIRMAGANPSGTWAPAANSCQKGLSSAQSSALTIRWDANADGSVSAAETITYAYDAGTQRVTRTVNGASAVLINNAAGLTFQYFKGATAAAMSGSPLQVTTADCDGVTTVRVTVQVSAARATTPTTVSVGARVALRNRVLGNI